jgi:hypothetical protein
MPGQGEGVALQSGADAREHRQRSTAAGGRSAGGAEGFDENVSLTSELHAVARFLCLRGRYSNQ